MPAPASIKLVATVTVENDMGLHHFDAEKAFVQSKLDTNVFMEMPPGCDDLSRKTVSVNKSLWP